MNTKKGLLLSLMVLVGAMGGGVNTAHALPDQPNNRLVSMTEETSNDLPECGEHPFAKAMINSERACQMSRIYPAMTYTLQVDIAAGKEVRITPEGCGSSGRSLVLSRDYREVADVSFGGYLGETHADLQLTSGMTTPSQGCKIKFEPTR